MAEVQGEVEAPEITAEMERVGAYFLMDRFEIGVGWASSTARELFLEMYARMPKRGIVDDNATYTTKPFRPV